VDESGLDPYFPQEQLHVPADKHIHQKRCGPVRPVGVATGEVATFDYQDQQNKKEKNAHQGMPTKHRKNPDRILKIQSLIRGKPEVLPCIQGQANKQVILQQLSGRQRPEAVRWPVHSDKQHHWCTSDQSRPQSKVAGVTVAK
jgi:hypothetical protein